jgi:iron complex outermembrane recepter protein
MTFSNRLRGGVSACALTLVLASTTNAQQALPTIDIGGASRRATAAMPESREPAEARPNASVGREAAIDADAPGSSQNGAGLGGRFTGYSVDADAPALSSKSNIPLIRNPVSLQVVTRQTLDDKQSISVQDALVGGVSNVQPKADTFYDGFTIRGFNNSSIFRNNLQAPSITHLQTANLQSIEVLKGPAAMEFGRLEPGGVVNLVVKRPLDTPYYSVQQQIGSWSHTRTTVDATGPLTQDKTWLYRVNASFDRGDSFRNFVFNQDAFIAPTISWRPDNHLRFNIDAEYQNTIFVADADSAIPAVGLRPAAIPVSRYLQNPAVTRANPSRKLRGMIGYDWTFDYDENWSVTNRFAYTDIQEAQRITDFYDGFNESTGDVLRGIWDINGHESLLTTNLDLKGKFETGPLKHSTLLGWDYLNDENKGYGKSGNAFDPINIYAPSYSLSGYSKQPHDFHFPFRQSWKGVYGQDMISFYEDRIHLLLGGRHDWASYGTGNSPTSFEEAYGFYNPDTGNGFQPATDQAWSPRLGVVLQPIPAISFYANYVRSFGATNGQPLPGNPPFPAERGLQWEGGVKAELLDKRLTATLAYYDIYKSGIVQSILGTQFSRPVGLVHSSGVEFDLAGRIDDNWSVIANYAYNDARIVSDASGPPQPNYDGVTYFNAGGQLGNRLQNAPLHSGALWVKYNALGDFKGLSLGGGVVAVGERQGDNNNSFQLPAYSRVDTMISYQLPQQLTPWAKLVTLQFNVKNLLNTTHYVNSLDRYGIAPGAPRNFVFSMRAEF